MAKSSVIATNRIAELNKKIVVDYSDAVNLTSYFRVCRSMLIMANQYEAENAIEQAFVLKKRFVILFLDHLTKRRDFSLTSEAVRNTWRKECYLVLGSLEQLNKRLRENYEAEEEARLAAEEAAAAKKLIEEQEAQLKKERESRENAEKERQQPVTTITLTPQPPSIQAPSIQPPAYDRSVKPVLPSAQSKNKFGWLPMSVPKNLASKFLQITTPNSQFNIETCATLCGHVTSSGFVISHIVFCKQSGTSDSCVTTSEVELLECMDKHSLIALGWIHTHPSQTVFMSSLDLHCQLSYQLMLPEAIAIVCSPRYNDVQYFSITPDYGNRFLLNCKHTGFHKHNATQDLYINSPHLVMNDNMVKVIDLR